MFFQKSVNILVSDGFVAKVSDFGIAKRLAIATMTARVGTLRWTAPEVFTNNSYSLGSDVYSFGVIVWEMLTLDLPWKNLSFDHIIEDRVKSGERLPISPFFPSQYQDLMVRCWLLNALDRPSFTDIIGMLERIPAISGSPQREVKDLENSLLMDSRADIRYVFASLSGVFRVRLISLFCNSMNGSINRDE